MAGTSFEKNGSAPQTTVADVDESLAPSTSGTPHANAAAAAAAGRSSKAQTNLDEAAAELNVNEKKLIRKIDFRLVPWLSVLYLLSFLDRSAIGNARLYGLEKELEMTGSQFSIASAIFFFPYALFEVPSNILLKRLRPSVWFPLITFFVGVCMMSQGLVSSYSGLLIARFFLGVAEAGLFPGANALLGGWYKRNEYGLRAAIFFSAATVSGAFGGLLSAAIHNMDGVGGYSGWRWIFIIIGLASIVIAFMSIWLCEDFPDTAKFLSDKERKFVVMRLQADQKFSAAGEEFQWDALWKAVLDWKTWVGMLIYAGVDGPLYAFSIFTPTIVQQLGYTATRANLISVPIYVFACLVTVGVGFLADRKGHRALNNMALISVGIAGYIILAISRLPGLSYFAIYLAAAGIYPCIPNTIALTSTSIEGAYKRTIVMAWIISFGNINGAATTNVYRTKDKPWYTLGHCMIILYLAMGWIASGVYLWGLRRSNARRARGLCDETILSEQHGSATPTTANGDPDVTAVNGSAGKTPTAAANSTQTDRDMDPALLAQAAEQRRAIEDKDRSSNWLFGALRAKRRQVGEASGGVYASGAEARAIKGDAYSGFVYSY